MSWRSVEASWFLISVTVIGTNFSELSKSRDCLQDLKKWHLLALNLLCWLSDMCSPCPLVRSLLYRARAAACVCVCAHNGTVYLAKHCSHCVFLGRLDHRCQQRERKRQDTDRIPSNSWLLPSSPGHSTYSTPMYLTSELLMFRQSAAATRWMRFVLKFLTGPSVTIHSIVSTKKRNQGPI